MSGIWDAGTQQGRFGDGHPMRQMENRQSPPTGQSLGSLVRFWPQQRSQPWGRRDLQRRSTDADAPGRAEGIHLHPPPCGVQIHFRGVVCSTCSAQNIRFTLTLVSESRQQVTALARGHLAMPRWVSRGQTLPGLLALAAGCCGARVLLPVALQLTPAFALCCHLCRGFHPRKLCVERNKW